MSRSLRDMDRTNRRPSPSSSCCRRRSTSCIGGATRVAAIQLVLFSTFFVASADAQCTSVKPLGAGRPGSVGGIADTIGLLFDDPALAPIAGQAVRSWSTCRNYGTGFPAFRVGERGTRTIQVRYVRGSDGLTRTCGEFRGDTVVLYATTVGPRGRRIPCGSLAENLAHELGHVLGLRDCPDLRACDTHAMTYIEEGTNGHGRTVKAEECQLVGQRWLTTAEHRRVQESREGAADRMAASLAPIHQPERPR